MSCSCPETNWMDGKGHDAGCPLCYAPLVDEGQRFAAEDQTRERTYRDGNHASRKRQSRETD